MSLRQGLLALLNEEPKHGYQLKVEFEAATGGMWPINVGQVYTTLDRLVRDGLVEAHDGGEQKNYHLTLDGYRQLGDWWQAVPSDDPPPRDELIVKVLLAVTTTPDEALDIITGQRTAVHELLQQRRRARRDANAGDTSIAHRLAEDALVVRAEADLRWLDLCESRVLEAHRAAPAGPGTGGGTAGSGARAKPPAPGSPAPPAVRGRGSGSGRRLRRNGS
jgi:DNA-binding PadR family transcriptional regulator